METLVFVFGAGLLASAMNALAGGGSFISLPALIAVGLSSVAANETSTVALFIGTVSSTWTLRAGVRGLGHVGLRPLLVASVGGGLLGAMLLIFTPPVVLDHVLPWLLLLATLTLGFGRQLGAALRARGWHIPVAALLAAQFVIAIYGGYFGGAVGIMFTAVWTLMGEVDLRALAPTRIFLVTAINTTAVASFAAFGVVDWPAALAMALGAAAGGALGAALGQRVSAPALRVFTLLVTSAMTLLFFRRAWM